MGGWGRDWARLLASRPDLAVTVGWVDVEPAMLELLRADVPTGVGAYFSRIEDALEATDADAVLVTTPLRFHAPVALAALAAGKHVLVEKPFAPSVAEAEAVVAAAEAADRILLVSQNYRHFPAARGAAALVAEGKLGAVNSVSVDFRKYSNTAPVEGHLHYTLEHPLLLDMAIHHFDLMRFVLGQNPVSVTSNAWNPPWSKFEQPAAALATIAFDGGAMVDYNGSWVSTSPDTLWSGEWRIECELGVIEFTARDNESAQGSDRLTVQPLGKPRETVKLAPLRDFDRAGSVGDFGRAIQSGIEPPTSGRRNLATLALTYGTIEAAETGERVVFD
jgi:predicted dehydrogenase